MTLKAMVPLVALLLSGGCALVDSGTPWESGPFKLHWIDDPGSVSLLQAEGARHFTEVVPAQVFAVGLDARFLVAQQHPGGDPRITHYFVVDRASEQALRLDPARVTGPLTEAEFQLRAKQWGLPPFSKVLAALK
ncbi:MAG TPA: hypothetical protein VJ505_00135 [Holophagaceae bacterium]|nr:hypothetical protein [Holophagaceae bacterium]